MLYMYNIYIYILIYIYIYIFIICVIAFCQAGFNQILPIPGFARMRTSASLPARVSWPLPASRMRGGWSLGVPSAPPVLCTWRRRGRARSTGAALAREDQ